jgi:enoyl-CoA hydratase/carnithine racemase
VNLPPFGLRVIKNVVNAGINVDLKNGLEIERQGFTILFSTEDKKEGVAAFLEKRNANFSGR